MSKCYNCDTEITALNRSVEHIIPNSCGGRLKSSKVLCKKCNNDFGSTFDADLAKQTNNLANLLKIKRDRGAPQNIKAKIGNTEEEIVIPFKGKMKKTRPKIEIKKEGKQTLISIEARNMAEFVSIAEGLKKKYPHLDIEKLKSEAKEVNEYLNNYITINETIGGESVFKCMAKSAVSYYMHNGGERKNIEHLLPYLNGIRGKDVVNFHLVAENIYRYKSGEVSHIINLVGNNSEAILYCYIELFNCHGYLILLNENYKGPDINKLYVYDLITSKSEDRTIHRIYTRVEVLEFISSEKKEIQHTFQQHYERVVGIANKNHDDQHIKSISRSLVNDALKDIPEGAMIDESVINRLAKITAEHWAKYLLHKQMGNINRKQ